MKKNVFRKRGSLNLFLRHTFTRTADDWGPLEDSNVIFYGDIPEHHPAGRFRDMGDIVSKEQAEKDLAAAQSSRITRTRKWECADGLRVELEEDGSVSLMQDGDHIVCEARDLDDLITMLTEARASR